MRYIAALVAQLDCQCFIHSAPEITMKLIAAKTVIAIAMLR